MVNSSHGMHLVYPIINCTACSPNSYCPLASIKDVNKSSFQQKSQVYAYPRSPSVTNFDDILLENTFNLTASSR